MFKKLKNNKGFTLVEVIVVAVIVAVLALVAIQLYQGYVKESRKNTADNLAASAAAFMQSVYNQTSDSSFSDLDGSGATTNWSKTTTGGNTVTFKCPKNAKIDVVNDSVKAEITGVFSETYAWK